MLLAGRVAHANAAVYMCQRLSASVRTAHAQKNVAVRSWLSEYASRSGRQIAPPRTIATPLLDADESDDEEQRQSVPEQSHARDVCHGNVERRNAFEGGGDDGW
jgi:hypothetical protein